PPSLFTFTPQASDDGSDPLGSGFHQGWLLLGLLVPVSRPRNATGIWGMRQAHVASLLGELSGQGGHRWFRGFEARFGYSDDEAQKNKPFRRSLVPIDRRVPSRYWRSNRQYDN